MCSDWFNEFPEFENEEVVQTFEAPGLPEPHPLEADTFARHEGVPGYDQEALCKAKIVLVGAGGLNSWVALGLARSGAKRLTIIDPDVVERSNLPRQLYYRDDLGKQKATAIAKNLVPHMMAGGTITGIALTFQEAAEEEMFEGDILVVGVDNNACRLAAVRYARQHRIPAAFTMLSLDGMRCQCFLQGPNEDDPCLWCALPNLDPEEAAPCASAIVFSCFLASSFTLFFTFRALKDWPEEVPGFNWTDGSLAGENPRLCGIVRQRQDCSIHNVCSLES